MDPGPSSADRKLRILDIFCGCGGSSMGFSRALRAAGATYEIIGIDIDRNACLTFQKNRVGQAIRADARFPPILMKSGLFDVVIGCPPCQGFTRMRHKPNADDPRNQLVNTFLEWIEFLRPKFVMFENVPWIQNSRYYRRLLRRLNGHGYKCNVGVLNAADYLVPQRRRRLILLGSRDKKPKLPTPIKKVVTVRDAIADLPPLKSGETHPTIPNHRSMRHSELVLKRIKNIPKNGGSRASLPPNLELKCHKMRKGFHDVYGRMRWDDVAPTLTSGCTNPSKGRFIHPEQDRGITPREAARLQTFPDSFVFFGSFLSISRQIGNAMPVKLSEQIAKAMLFE